MLISCRTKEELCPFGTNGKAVISGYWNPEKKPVYRLTLLEWADGRIAGLQDFQTEQDHSDTPGDTPGDVHDWRGYLLMPGWIDAHVHLALDSVDFNLCLERWRDPSAMAAQISQFLRRYREVGIVAIRDGGDLPGYGWLARENTAQKVWSGPEVVSVREAVYRVGSYGRFLGRGIVDIHEWRDRKKYFLTQGQDQVKVIVSGIISFRKYGVVGAPQWPLSELKEIVSDAHACGLPVMAHVSGAEAINLALAAGVDTLEHGYFVTSAQLEEISSRGVAWVPTVAPTGNILHGETGRYTPEEKTVLMRIVEEHLERIAEAHALHVRLGLGTDAGAYLVPHGDALFQEMDWFRQAGLPALETSRLATLGNARIIGRPELGILRPGSAMVNLQLRALDSEPIIDS